MFASLDPNYKPVDLYKAFWHHDRHACWGGKTRKERAAFCKEYLPSIRALIKDRKTKAQAEADLKALIDKHPELADKMVVQEFNYL